MEVQQSPGIMGRHDWEGISMERIFRGSGMSIRYVTVLAVAVTATGCAYMGTKGATRADAARALGMSPGDVVVVSREYTIPASGGEDYALAGYTVMTNTGLTYVCDVAAPPPGQAVSRRRPVCKPKR